MALPGNRGQYDIVNFPRHFANWRANLIKATDPQVKIFDNITTATDQISSEYSVNNCRRFTVQTSGTIVCIVEVTADPASGSWVTVGTSTNSDTVEITNHYQHVRLRATSATNGTAWLLRDYRQGGA